MNYLLSPQTPRVLSFPRRGVCDCRVGHLLVTAIGWVLVMGCACAGVSSETGTVQEVLRELFRGDIVEAQQGTTNGLGELLRGYDLAVATDKLMRQITVAPQFSEYVRKREPELKAEQLRRLGVQEQGRLMMDYVEGQPDIKPEIKAWLRVYAVYLPWDEAMTNYRALREYRPADLPPKLIMLYKLQGTGGAPRTSKQCNEWAAIVGEALPLAETPELKSHCARVAALGTMRFRRMAGGEVAARRVWTSLREAELPAASTNQAEVMLFNRCKMWTAIAAQDSGAAIELARKSGARELEPLLLMIAGQRAEAYEALRALRSNLALAQRERSAVETMEPMILIYTRRYGEAHEVIKRQRQRPSLTSQTKQWLDTMERILAERETAVSVPRDEPP